MSSTQPGYVFNDSKFGSLFIGDDSGAGVKRARQVELHSASNAHLKLFEDGGFELTSSPSARTRDNINSNAKDGLNISANNITLDSREGTLTLRARIIKFESTASDETLVFRSSNNINIEASDTIKLEASVVAIGARTKLVLGSCGPIYMKGTGGITIIEPKSKLIPTSVSELLTKLIEQLLPGANC